MARLSIRIDFETPDGRIGPGMAELLSGIADHGSIRRAAAAMGMSYRKAWLLVQAIEQTFGTSAVTTATGGTDGGGTKLSELGRTLLKSYRRIEARAARAADPELRALSAMIQTDRKSKPRTKRKK
jgi:molybdate transport system regulatory protein